MNRFEDNNKLYYNINLMVILLDIYFFFYAL